MSTVEVERAYASWGLGPGPSGAVVAGRAALESWRGLVEQVRVAAGERDRWIVALAREGRSNQETADLLGTDLGTVRAAVFRAGLAVR